MSLHEDTRQPVRTPQKAAKKQRMPFASFIPCPIIEYDMEALLTTVAQTARSLTDAPPVAESIIRQIQELDGEGLPAFRVILFNDEEHSMDQVALQVQKATGCCLEKAEAIMLEAHRTGQAIVYSGDLEACNKVAGILQQIGLRVSVESD